MIELGDKVLIYVERTYDDQFNAEILRDWGRIARRLDEAGGFRLLYMPFLWDQLAATPDILHYYRPDTAAKPLYLTTAHLLKSHRLSDIAAPSLVYFDEDMRRTVRPLVPGLPFEAQAADFAAEIAWRTGAIGGDLGRRLVAPAQESRRIYCDEGKRIFAERTAPYSASAVAPETDAETEQLLAELRERVARLRTLGIEEWLLRDCLQAHRKLSRLVVTPDYRLILPDYGELEITMLPLPRAIYLLFLLHPEGIPFKALPDFRPELEELYRHVCRTDDPAIIRSRVARATDPLNNSINEKRSRIREAFIRHFDDSVACHYYITGRPGGAMQVSLDRSLLDWQA